MRFMSPVLIMVLLAATADPASSQEVDKAECLRKNPGITSPVEMATCTFDLAGSERALESALAERAGRLSAGQRDVLARRQQAWLAARDRRCVREAGSWRNTGHGSAVIACTADANRARPAELQRPLKASR